jgi:cell division protein FtsQ
MRRNRRRGTGALVLARRILGAGLGIALAAGGAFVLGVAAGAASRHPYFGLREIEVLGFREPAVVAAWSGLALGRSLWTIDPEAVESRLAAEPRLLAASVRRAFPDRVVITVEERRPLAILLLAAPRLVAADGVAFRPLDGEPVEGLPYVRGLGAEDLEARPAWAAERLRRVMRILDLWSRQAAWPPVSEVKAETTGDLVVYPQKIRMAIRFGADAGDDEFARLGAVLGEWQGREAEVSAVDLTMPGQAVVRLRADKPPARRVRI